VEITATERNMKLHVWSALLVCVVASEVRLALAAQLAAVISVVLVLGAEGMNSALEALVDLHTAERREEARRVKDAAAGAVLAVAAGAVVVGGFVVSESWEGGLRRLDQLRANSLWDSAIVVLAASLLALGGRRVAWQVVAAGCGAVLLAILAARTVSLPFTALAGALFLLAAASGRYARLDGQPSAGAP